MYEGPGQSRFRFQHYKHSNRIGATVLLSERVVEYYGMELCQNIRAQQSTDINLDWIYIIFVRAHIPGTAVYSTQKCTFNLTRCRLAACRREAAHFGVGGSASAKQTRVPLMSKAKRTERGGKRG